jgi:hypothetical protein
MEVIGPEVFGHLYSVPVLGPASVLLEHAYFLF